MLLRHQTKTMKPHISSQREINLFRVQSICVGQDHPAHQRVLQCFFIASPLLIFPITPRTYLKESPWLFRSHFDGFAAAFHLREIRTLPAVETVMLSRKLNMICVVSSSL